MVVKKLISVKEVNEKGEVKEVYRGEDKRFYNQNYQTGIFGIPLGDWLKVGVTLFAIATFMIKDNIRISNLEDGQTKLTAIADSMSQFMQQSDNFHSAIFHTQFKGGRPLNDGYENRGNVVGKELP